MGRLRYWRRRWSVDHAPLLQSIYRFLEGWLVRLDPLWRRLGYSRLEMPFALTEKVVKGVLFDCQMCGQCALSQTGMSCPMNCPKSLRYGPCGGVRADGRCEVKPDMPCVWVEAWRGKQLLGDNDQEGRRLCVELMQQLAEIPGVAGVHIMAYRQESAVSALVKASGVLGDRVPWYPGRDAP